MEKEDEVKETKQQKQNQTKVTTILFFLRFQINAKQKVFIKKELKFQFGHWERETIVIILKRTRTILIWSGIGGIEKPKGKKVTI